MTIKKGSTVRTYTDRIRGAHRGITVSEAYYDERQQVWCIDVRWETGAVCAEHINAVEVLS